MGGTPSLLELHRRLLAGDKTAGNALSDQLLESLQRKLPGRDAENKFDAAVDALIDFISRPDAFDPHKGQIEPFLLLAAKRNLMNVRRGDHRRHVRETKAAAYFQNNYVELPDPVENLIGKDNEALYRRLLAAIAPADRPVAELMLQGERRTAVYAKALGLDGQTTEQQRMAVKRAKDRVTKALQRLKGR